MISACQRAPFVHAGASGLNTFDTSVVVADADIQALIEPYKQKIDQEMNSVIGYTGMAMNKSRPESVLGNAMADLLVEYSNMELGKNVDLCVLNFGGLRTVLPEGDITRRKVYELMPFDNSLVVLELNQQEMMELAQHILVRGGEPIGSPHGVILNQGGFRFGSDTPINRPAYRVVTSNYLAEGGDNFAVFKRCKKREDLGVLLRDAFIIGFEKYTSPQNPLVASIENRIELK